MISGGEMGATTNDVLKFRKIIEFQTSWVAVYFSKIYLVINERTSINIYEIS